MLGFLLGLSDVVMRAFRPLINFFHAIVDMAWIPLFVLWFGYGEKTILMSLAYASAFPVLFNFLLGVQSTPKTMVQATQTLGATRIDLIRHVFLPNAIPNLIVGFRIGAGFAFRALIAAEVIAGRSGIGFMIFEARESQLIGRTIVGMVLLGALWVAIDRLVLRAIEAATIERWGMVQGRLK
jgi:NitT/TauT family transport system permease protein/taurine transport system permease protein